MNATSDVVAEFQHSQRGAAVNISAGRRMYWLLQREFWESRSIYAAPLITAALFLLGTCIQLIHVRSSAHSALGESMVEQLAWLEQSYRMAAYVLMAVTLLVAVFYSLDALYGERRDRSILFWKSLPVCCPWWRSSSRL